MTVNGEQGNDAQVNGEKVDGFDEKKAYVAQEEEGQSFFDDGRELDLLHFIFDKPDIASIRNSPQRVLGAIDEYGRTKKYMMNVGDDKGKIVCEQIDQRKPEVMVELGGYIGYSALLFGDAVRRNGGSRYFSIERNPVFGAVIMTLVDLAGLADLVKVVIGPSDDCIKRLHADTSLFRIDMMFLDHYKPAYLTDVKLCESLSLIRPGTLLCADNVIRPGNPPYLEYVRSSVEDKRKALQEGTTQGESQAEAIDQRWKKQYENRIEEEKLDSQQRGNPNLVYESKLVNSFEPTGVPDGIEITKCVA